MPSADESRFAATREGLRRALEMIEHSGAARNLDPDLIARLLLIVEELFTNTIKYGYGRECDQPVRVGLSWAPSFSLIYEDDAPAFDPTAWRPPTRSGALADQPEGQAGILMVLGLSTTIRYQATATGNRLVLTFEPKR